MSRIDSHILIVDDEPEIRRFLSIGLRSHDFRVIEAETGREALRLATTRRPDLVVLDLGLPDISGFEVIEELRGWTRVPVIVLSVRASEAEKVRAFDLGANDYVTKPFGMAELLARIRAHLRGHLVEEAGAEVLTAGDLELDLAKRRVSLRGERIQLTPKEYQLLSLLMRNQGKVVTHRQLMQEIWGQGQGDDNQYLRIYVRQLRKKIEKDRQRDLYIHNESGIGYRLEHIVP